MNSSNCTHANGISGQCVVYQYLLMYALYVCMFIHIAAKYEPKRTDFDDNEIFMEKRVRDLRDTCFAPSTDALIPRIPRIPFTSLHMHTCV